MRPKFLRSIKRTAVKISQAMRYGWNFGNCPICEKKTLFYAEGKWLRDQYLCVGCQSIPRGRALIHVLETQFPEWRKMRIHESSPGGVSSDKIARECPDYIASQYFIGTPFGEIKDGARCENLEAQTFPDAEFDMVITQDVFEHIFSPGAAFSEIARTLKPGGVHVFTVPWYHEKPTLVRVAVENGEVKLLEKADYHANPIDPEGSLVATEWGAELCDFIYQHSRMTTTIIRIKDRSMGIDGEFREVFVSRKPDGRRVVESGATRQYAVAAGEDAPVFSGAPNG